MSDRFNLPFVLGAGGNSAPDGLDPNLKGVFQQLYTALQQINHVFHDYLGIGQQLQDLWPLLTFDQTLHRSSPWRFYAKAKEDITYGQAINLVLDAGVLKIQKANATNNTKMCHGFCTTSSGILTGSSGECILMQGLLTGVAGLTVGTRYFLSTTSGLLTNVAPVAAGNIEQAIGVAVDASALLFCTDFDYLQH